MDDLIDTYAIYRLLSLDHDPATRRPTVEVAHEALDVRVVADGVNRMRSPERALIVITHSQRLLDYIVPDFVHVLSQGRIVRSGGRELALELEERGYGWISESAADKKGAAA